MLHRTPMLVLLLAACGLLAGPARAEETKKKTAGSRPAAADRSAGLREARPAPDAPAAGLLPVTRGRAATLPSVTTGRAAGLLPVTTGRSAGLAQVTTGRAANLPSVTRDRAAGLSSVTRDRAATLAPVTTDRAATLPPVTTDRAATLPPVTVDRAAGHAPVTRDRAAGLAPVTSERLANLSPVTMDRAALLSSVTRDRLAAKRGRDFGGEDPGALLDSLLAHRDGRTVVAFGDGYLAPYGFRPPVSEGFFDEVLRSEVRTPWGSSRHEHRVTRSFRHEGFHGHLLAGHGSVLRLLDAIDPYGPHRFGRRPLGKNVPRGVSNGSYYFPAAFFIRPVSRSAYGFNKGHNLILVPWDVVEAIPEDFDRTLRNTKFPMVMGDVAFKDGQYVQAALSFREALDRKPENVAGRFALGDALLALRNYGYAATAIRAGLAEAPKWADDLDRHGVYGNREDFDRHLAEVEEFTREYPGTPDGWFLLGYTRFTSGDPELRDAAAEAFAKALEIEPGDPAAEHFLARLEKEREEAARAKDTTSLTSGTGTTN